MVTNYNAEKILTNTQKGLTSTLFVTYREKKKRFWDWFQLNIAGIEWDRHTPSPLEILNLYIKITTTVGNTGESITF
jgi:hypothetical protein